MTDSRTSPEADPLCFLHVPKTGGTSLINLMREATDPSIVFTQPGNLLSAEYSERLAASGLPRKAIIYGHPDWGACRAWRGRARFVTLLREPRRQIVSHYQHACRDPAMPQHAAAKALGLAKFLRIYFHAIVFQTQTLYRSIADPEQEYQRAISDPAYGDAFEPVLRFAAQHRAVSSFLSEMTLVGTLDTIESFAACLAVEMGWTTPRALPHTNRAPSAQGRETADLLIQLAELEKEPALAPLFAIESATYQIARSIALGAMARQLRRSRPAEAVDPIADGMPSRWTGSRQLSCLRLALDHPGACRLVLHADRLHAIKAEELMLCYDGRWLGVAVSHEPTGLTIFEAELVPNGSARLAEVWLYLQWNRYPDSPPWYPAIHLTKISLEPLGQSIDFC